MSCSKCIYFEECEKIQKLEKAHQELIEVKYSQPALFEKPENFRRKRSRRCMELRSKYYDLRRKQMKCLRRRIIIDSKGYICFRS